MQADGRRERERERRMTSAGQWRQYSRQASLGTVHTRRHTTCTMYWRTEREDTCIDDVTGRLVDVRPAAVTSTDDVAAAGAASPSDDDETRHSSFVRPSQHNRPHSHTSVCAGGGAPPPRVHGITLPIPTLKNEIMFTLCWFVCRSVNKISLLKKLRTDFHEPWWMDEILAKDEQIRRIRIWSPRSFFPLFHFSTIN